MEVTLEKIELVKDRTGVSYKDAKDALEAADGSVVDAIIAIEDSIDNAEKKSLGEQSGAVLDKVKELIKKGNVSKIVVKKTDGDVIMNLPVNAGIVAALVAPWGVLAGVLSTFAFKCVVEVVKTDGTIVEVSERANDVAGKALEKGSDIADVTKQKAGEVYDKVKNNEQLADLLDKAGDTLDKAGDTIKEKFKKAEDAAGDIVEETIDTIDKWTEEAPAAEEAKEACCSAEEAAKEGCCEAKDAVCEAVEEVAEAAEEAVAAAEEAEKEF